MKKILRFLSIASLCLLAGCFWAHRKPVVEEGQQAKVVPAPVVIPTEDLNLVAGFGLLEDKRPQTDIAYMSSVRENVSAQVLDTIRSTNLFSAVNSPATKQEPFAISGEIRQFHWESFDTMISYVPVMNVFNLFGLPSTNTLAEVAIYVKVTDAKTNTMLFEFTEQFIKRAKYNIYNFKESKASEELSECFQVVLQRLRQRLLREKITVIETAKSHVPVVIPAGAPQNAVIEEKIKAADEKMKAAEEKMKEVEKKAEEVEKMAQKVEEKVKEAEKKVKGAAEEPSVGAPAPASQGIQ